MKPADEELAGAQVPLQPAGGGAGSSLPLPPAGSSDVTPRGIIPGTLIPVGAQEAVCGSACSGVQRRQTQRHQPHPNTKSRDRDKPSWTRAPPGGVCKCARDRRSSRKDTLWPAEGPSWRQDRLGPEPRAPRRNGPRVRRMDSPDRPHSPCPPLGLAPEGRTCGGGPGTGRRRALTSPRRRAWAAAALRLAVVEAGAGSGEWGPRRRAAPLRDRAHRTAAAPLPPQLPRWPLAGRGHPRFRFRCAARWGGCSRRPGGPGRRLAAAPDAPPRGTGGACALAGSSDGAGPEERKSALARWQAAPGGGPRGGENQRVRARRHLHGLRPHVPRPVWSGYHCPPGPASAMSLSSGRPGGPRPPPRTLPFPRPGPRGIQPGRGLTVPEKSGPITG